jgi:hypothetical protein
MTSLYEVKYKWFPKGGGFSPGSPVSPPKKIDRHNITEILLKVALNTINHKQNICKKGKYFV